MTHFSYVFVCVHPLWRLFVIAPYSLVLPGEIEARLTGIVHHSATSGWNGDQLRREMYTDFTAFKSKQWDRTGWHFYLHVTFPNALEFLSQSEGSGFIQFAINPNLTEKEHWKNTLAPRCQHRRHHLKAQHCLQVVTLLYCHIYMMEANIRRRIKNLFQLK